MKNIVKKILTATLALAMLLSSLWLPSLTLAASTNEMDAILSAKKYSNDFENEADSFEQFADFTNDAGEVIEQDYMFVDSANAINAGTVTKQNLGTKVFAINAGSTSSDFDATAYKSLVNAATSTSPTDNDYNLAYTSVSMLSPRRAIWQAIAAQEGSLQTAEFDLQMQTATSAKGGAMIVYAYSDEYNFDYITLGYWSKTKTIVINQHHVIEGKTSQGESFRWAHLDANNDRSGNKVTPDLGQTGTDTDWGAVNTNLNWIHVSMSYVDAKGITVPQFILTADYGDDNTYTYTYTVKALTSTRTSEDFVNVSDAERMIAIGTDQSIASYVNIDNFNMTFTTPAMDAQAEIDGFRTTYANEIAGNGTVATYKAAIDAYADFSDIAKEALAVEYAAIDQYRIASVIASKEYSANFESAADKFEQLVDFKNDAGAVIEQIPAVVNSPENVGTVTNQNLGEKVLAITSSSTTTDFASSTYTALVDAATATSPTTNDYNLAHTSISMLSPEKAIWQGIKAKNGYLQTAEFDLMMQSATSVNGGVMLVYSYKDEYNFDYISIGYWGNSQEIVLSQHHVIEGKTEAGKSFRWAHKDANNNASGNKLSAALGQNVTETAWGKSNDNINWLNVAMSYVVVNEKSVPQFVLTADYGNDNIYTVTYTLNTKVTSTRTQEEIIDVPEEERVIAIGVVQSVTKDIYVDNFNMTFTTPLDDVQQTVDAFRTEYEDAFEQGAPANDVLVMYNAYNELAANVKTALADEVNTAVDALRPTSKGSTLTTSANPTLCFIGGKPVNSEYKEFGVVITTNTNMFKNDFTELTKETEGAHLTSKTYGDSAQKDAELVFILHGLFDEDAETQEKKWASVLVARYYVVYELEDGSSVTLYNTNDFGKNPTGEGIVNYENGEIARSINGILKSFVETIDGVATTEPYSNVLGTEIEDKNGASQDAYLNATLAATYAANSNTVKKATAEETFYLILAYKEVFTQMKNNGLI